MRASSDPTQRAPFPRRPRPIVSIGAGGIVADAHLPAYRLAGFEVDALFDLNQARAEEVAARFGVKRVCLSLEEAIRTAPARAVFDLAVPPSVNLEILEQLPDGAPVLIQKPLGENLEQARALVALCRRKHLKAAVNFQLRYAPYILAARHLIEQGTIGEVHDMEVRLTIYMPWHLWTFLEGIPRVEILYHSVHYLDLIRSFLGEPAGIWAQTIKHPKTQKLASTRTSMILNYGDVLRATINVNHGHEFGPAHQESYVKWEGTRGAIKARIGLLLNLSNYPKGEPDKLEYCALEEGKAPEWIEVPVEGSWFPHAFMGTMSSVMRFADGEIPDLPTSVEDAFKTMALVEAAHASSASGGTSLPPL